ncbi:circularly permuted type 2 ATP-grasp protein [Insolitispirillum peregrinum]|uniref:Uncharacterized conserved protein, circularly permuted ATPgrasp superfamily n=1 Tax=Insolitispirillum peregrinum TaxID=80876 RepID=A0A1N7Q348_9PROT|nr:circularly permuted type 2 ATP-grasp protein [Insolitispirillum peregrinum]SIT17270.1 Uncharacterized conserved protein, circularly permuted ATPgrasp superfamily [Insolitispirillum peregrinum]
MGTGGEHIQQATVDLIDEHTHVDLIDRQASATPIDEMVDGEGQIRSHWQSLVGSICSLPGDVMGERIERIHRHLEENGITRRAPIGTPGVAPPTAPWEFDLLPVILPAQEWEGLAQGLRQRATLIDAILRDLYGPQTLLADGSYPASLVLGNRRFLRAARHALKPGARFLHAYAADLARGPDGQWRVVADRLDAPAGSGFVLENRLVLARALPEIFRTAPVRRLRPFYELWQQALQAMAPAHNDNPRMVLLTPGPFSETYVEHASLARELNLILAEGADLTVRGDHVFLKTLSGLHPVDVLLRRIDSEYTDPLELRPDSALGASGIMQAIRNKTLAVGNAIGCGVLETPALAAFLPWLAQRLLRENLLLPSLPSWWCGTSGPREDGLRFLDNRLIRRTFPSSATEAFDPMAMDEMARNALLADIARRPHEFVVQEKPIPSTTPVWSNGRMEPRPLILRMFVIATADGSYTVLPGGFARVGTQEKFSGLEALSLAHGGISKDVWVLTAAEGDTVVPAPPPAPPLVLRRSAGELPSRVADNLYWLGRYAERADNAARLLRCCISRLAEGILGPRERTEVAILSSILAERGLLDRPVPEALVDGPVLMSALTRACSPGQALDELLVAVGRLLPGVRDRLSPDLLHVLGPRLDHARSKFPNGQRDLDGALDALDSLIIVLAALGGMVAENMTRHAGWRFLDMGRKLERAQFTSGILRGLAARTIPGPAEPGLRLALELCDSSITYRSRYRTVLQSHAVLDLVIADEGNPRSLAHQIGRLIDHLGKLPSPDGQPVAQMALRLAHAAMAVIWALELEFMSGNPAVVRRLDGDLFSAEQHLAGLNDAITRTFFSHIKALQTLGYSGIDTDSAAQGFAP